MLVGVFEDSKVDIKVKKVKLLSARLLIIYWETGEKQNVASPGEVLKGEHSGWLQASWRFNDDYTAQLCLAFTKFTQNSLCLIAGVAFKHS